MGLTANGRTITHARTQFAAWGVWYVDVTLDSPEAISGSVDLELNDLRLKGTVLSGGAFSGRAKARIVGGAGGISRTVAPRGYANDAGVKVSTIVRDVADECGETFIAPSSSTSVGNAFARPEVPGGRVLELVAPRAWYVGEDGAIRLGRRAARSLPSSASILSRDEATGVVTIAGEELAPLLPGLTIEGREAVDIEHEISPGKVRTRAWLARAGESSRQHEALRRLIVAAFPDLKFRGVTEYRVDGASGKRLNLTPVRQSSGMPSLLRVPVRPGIPGADADHAVGSKVLVSFIDADPARPCVTSFEDARSEAFVPDELRFAEGTKGVARKDDEVLLGYCLWDSVTRILYFSPAALGPVATVYVPWGTFPSGTTISLFAANPASPVAPTPGTPGTPWSGVISSASDLVRCG